MDWDMIDNTTASQGRTPERKPDKLKSQKENIPSRGFNTEITVGKRFKIINNTKFINSSLLKLQFKWYLFVYNKIILWCQR